MNRPILPKLLILVLVFFGWGYNIPAQSLSPAIVSFTGDLLTITLAETEAGFTPLRLTWHVVNLTAQHRLGLETYRLNTWESVVEETAILLPSDSRSINVAHSLTFRSPTYRLVIRDTDGRIVDESILVIPYANNCGADCRPAITTFTTPEVRVAADALAQRTALIPVNWSITNRSPTANPVFEQVLDDGSAVVVELPREFLWVPSTGEGLVAPTLPLGDRVHLRLRLVDMVSGEVYAEQTIDLPIGVTTGQLPSTTVTGDTPRIVSFTASPASADPNSLITLSWEVSGGGGVLLSWLNKQSQSVNLPGQPLSGATTVALTGVKFYVYDGTINKAHFDLTVTDTNGQILVDANGQTFAERAEVTLLTEMRIDSFTISPNPVEHGGTVTLTWAVSQATDIAITRLSPAGVFLSSSVISGLPASGSIGLVIPEEYTVAITYYLSVTDANGLVQGQLATVSIVDH